MPLASELCTRLNSIGNLPSPPNVATEIIELAQDPELEMDKIASAISKDPVLTTKILRIANSALYARRRKSDNLAQALLVLGLNATVTLSLSFSLVTSLSKSKTAGVNYTHYWKRSLLSAISARAVAQSLGLVHREELFLGALLQDLGMLAIDKIAPEIYGDSGFVGNHLEVAQQEREILGADHADIGEWMLTNWNIPATICAAVGHSHQHGVELDSDEQQLFSRSVAISGLFADVLLIEDEGAGILKLSKCAEEAFGMDRLAVTNLLTTITEAIPDTEAIFEMDLVNSVSSEGILDQAREILMIRNLQSLHEVSALRETAESLENRAQELEAENRRDALTGVYNRSHLDMVLQKEFNSATNHGWPLSIAFVDMDHFKAVNDTYGHLAGDTVLKNAAALLKDKTRDSDIVARYGGEEFILVLPGSDSTGAQVVCERIVKAFRSVTHNTGQEQIRVTVSMGVATLYDNQTFESVKSFVDAADQALYRAKSAGRDRLVVYGASGKRNVGSV